MHLCISEYNHIKFWLKNIKAQITGLFLWLLRLSNIYINCFNLPYYIKSSPIHTYSWRGCPRRFYCPACVMDFATVQLMILREMICKRACMRNTSPFEELIFPHRCTFLNTSGGEEWNWTTDTRLFRPL